MGKSECLRWRARIRQRSVERDHTQLVLWNRSVEPWAVVDAEESSATGWLGHAMADGTSCCAAGIVRALPAFSSSGGAPVEVICHTTLEVERPLLGRVALLLGGVQHLPASPL